MMLNDKLLSRFREDGNIFLPEAIDSATMKEMRAEAERCMGRLARVARERSDILIEDDDTTVRLVRDIHLESEKFGAWVSHPVLLNMAKALLGPDIYVFGTKLNLKRAFSGGHFDWHQDFSYWNTEVARPDLITVLVYLDDVGPHNGPPMVVPGSHRNGMIAVPHRDDISPEQAKSYPSTRLNNMQYSLPNEPLIEHAGERGIFTAMGAAGSVFTMNVNIFHASGINLSPFDRRAFVIRYNRLDNAPPGSNPVAL